MTMVNLSLILSASTCLLIMSSMNLMSVCSSLSVTALLMAPSSWSFMNCSSSLTFGVNLFEISSIIFLVYVFSLMASFWTFSIRFLFSSWTFSIRFVFLKFWWSLFSLISLSRAVNSVFISSIWLRSCLPLLPLRSNGHARGRIMSRDMSYSRRRGGSGRLTVEMAGATLLAPALVPTPHIFRRWWVRT